MSDKPLKTTEQQRREFDEELMRREKAAQKTATDAVNYGVPEQRKRPHKTSSSAGKNKKRRRYKR